MAKLSVALLALVAAFLVVADASIIRTTITTTEIEEDNPQQCSPQQLKGKQFNSCQRYLSKSYRPYDILRVVDVNPSLQEGTLKECCKELRELQNPQCSCEALKKIIREESQKGTRYQGQQEMSPMLHKAKNIPEQCNLGVRSCSFQMY